MADALHEGRPRLGDQLSQHRVPLVAVCGTDANLDELVVAERLVDFGDHGRV